jgi:tRNA dimethylallyltransferase
MDRPTQMPVVAVVGPTAAGKTAFSLLLAEGLGGEIISADSRQVYRGMDIGTAKATLEEQLRVPHHLIDLVAPDQALTAAQYQALAYRTIDAVRDRDRLPFIVGGSGLYVRAVLEGWTIPEVAPQPELRAELAARAQAQGAEALHARLAQLDPAAAERIQYQNVRRVIRALEVCLVTGRPISDLQHKTPPPYRVYELGVTRRRPELYARIDRRVDLMMAQGLLDEVRHLAAAGYAWDLPAMSGLGYRQIGQYLRGELGLAETVALIKRQTRRFVHQQYTWFRPDDPHINWIDPDQVRVDDVVAGIAKWLRSSAL